MSQLTAVWSTLIRVLGAVPEEEDASAALLGSEHPLAHGLALVRDRSRQLLVAAGAALVSVVAAAAGLDYAIDSVGASCAACGVFALALVQARSTVKDQVLLLLSAAGADAIPLRVVQRERSKLASREERERIARALERMQSDAQSVRLSRALPGVVNLRHLGSEVEAVTRRLRHGPARVRGVALASRLLCDGLRSPLYGGNRAALREELHRIRYLLD